MLRLSPALMDQDTLLAVWDAQLELLSILDHRRNRVVSCFEIVVAGVPPLKAV